MNSRQSLDEYLTNVQRLMRAQVRARAGAVILATALVVSVAAIAITNLYAFSGTSLLVARVVLLAAVGLTTFAAIRQWRSLTRAAAIARAERDHAGFEQRLTTFATAGPDHPFAELLAADTLDHAAPVEQFVPRSRLLALSAAAGVSLAALVLLFVAPGYWGYGARLLYAGQRANAAPLYSLTVRPGNITVRRHGDQAITAILQGLASPRIFARYQSAAKWEAAPMNPGRPGFQYLFAGLPEDVDYYVVAGAMRSPTYHIRVRDLPVVRSIAVTYHYPSWTGLPAKTDPHAGDLHAVAGTKADLTLTTDQPLPSGTLQLDSGQTVALTPLGPHSYRGTIDMQKDGVYHVAAQIDSQPTRLSEDFFIAAPPPAPPQVAIVRPQRDYRASPIEEVTVAAQASDEFGLRNMALHYSVNGGPEKTVNMLSHPGAKQADGHTVISFEDFKAQPGDLVSVYASAQDGNTQSRSDMFFIQADPFEREFSQSQQSGGGGGGGGAGNQSAQIADREKEIIAATFRQQNDKTASAQLAADTAKLLSQSQSTLHDQALSLAGRMDSRELTDENQAFSDFQKDMVSAATAMAPSSQSLQNKKWSAAIPNEEKALQYLLRADATFRQIQVAFGARGGGGGGGGGAARDLASLFDLELDTQKNQYETQQQASSSEQKAQQIDDTLKKLDDLAQRQQQLAQQHNNNGTQTAEQKWQQDLLRRQAEQLQQQMQQMAQSGQQSSQGRQSGQSGQSGQSSSSQSPSSQAQQSSSSQGQPSSQSSGQSSSQSAAQTAANRMRQAEEAMQRAAQNGSPASARQAADALRQARDALSSLQRQSAATRLADMASQADQLAASQKQQADQIRQMIASKKPASDAELNQLIANRQQDSDKLDRLEQSMRNAARDLNSAQPTASSKLRQALDGADSSDLSTRLQRSADWLRNGNFSDSNETALTNDLRQLGQNVRQAQQSLGPTAGATSNAQLSAAIDQIDRLRRQLARGGAGTQPGNANQNANANNGRGGANGGRNGNGNANGALGNNRNAGNVGNTGGVGNIRDGAVGNARGGAGDRYGNGGYDLGNTHIVGEAVAPQAGPNPADTQREIEQDLATLNRLRQTLPPDASYEAEFQQLIAQTRNLDPSRFPGNPAMVAEMHEELLRSVDTLELQIRQKLDSSQGGQVRGQSPTPPPPGYEDAVAAYFKRLSAGGGH